MKRTNLPAVLMASAVALFFFKGCETAATVTPTVTPVIGNINGAAAGSGTIGSLIVIHGSGFGAISTATTNYSVDFWDNAAVPVVVASATVDFSTTGNWTDATIKATVPTGLTVSTAYVLKVTTPNGTSSGLTFLVVPSVSFSPSTILWSQTLPLPDARQGFSAVVGSVGTRSYLFVVGGNTATASTTDGIKMNIGTAYQAMINASDGTLKNATWTVVTPMPVKRAFAAPVFANSYNSVISNGLIYILGGLDDTGAATNTVFLAGVGGNGTIPASGTSGTWGTTTPLPEALYAESAVIFQGRIYIAGGNNASGVPVAKVYSAQIGNDGTLGSWTTLADLPAPLAYHQMVEIADTLYVLGGDNAAADPLSNTASASVQDAVYYNPINIVDGSLAASWTVNGNTLAKAREKFSAIAAGGTILVSGGLYGGSPGSSEQSYASINSDGSLSSFSNATGSHTISSTGGYNFFNHGSAWVVDSSGLPHIFILGGADVDTGALHVEVWYQH